MSIDVINDHIIDEMNQHLYELNEEQRAQVVKLLAAKYPAAQLWCPNINHMKFQVRQQARNADGQLYMEVLDLGDLAELLKANADIVDASAAKEARAKRDALLAACDWSQLPDVKQELREAYAGYRQALRDIPEQAGFPHEIEWPEVPSTDAAKLLVKP